MKQILHTPEGVRDIHNVECTKKYTLRTRIQKVLRQYGYHDIETPSFEYEDVFGQETGSLSAKELYKFFDRDGNTLVLRPDITPSIARAAAVLYADEDMPLRLCYAGQTFINHTSYQGRLKETTQLGAELIGDGSVMADAEMIVMVIDAMKKAGLKEFQVSIGQADFYQSLVKEAGLEEVLLKKPELFGSVELLNEAKQMTTNPAAIQAVERLEEVYELLQQYGVADYVSFDLGMTGTYMYYTGVIFRAYTFGTGDAIVKGGRYDNLMSSFGKDQPAIGFAVVLDELMNALERQKIEIPYARTNTLLLFSPAGRPRAIAYAKELRGEGKPVELMAFDPDKTIEDYKAFGIRHGLGGILYLEDEKNTTVINLTEEKI